MLILLFLALILPANSQSPTYSNAPVPQPISAFSTFDSAQTPLPAASHISTHVLDIALGRPAIGINCTAFWWDQMRQNWIPIGNSRTDERGRIPSVIAPELSASPLSPGLYKLRLETGQYLVGQQRQLFFPFVEIAFQVDSPAQSYHIPLVVSEFGYSVYRGH